MISLLQGVDSGEITVGHCLRLLRSQAVLVAEVPAFAKRSRQAAADLQQCSARSGGGEVQAIALLETLSQEEGTP